MVVIIVTWLSGRMMWSSNSGTNKYFVSSPKHLAWFRSPLSLLFSGDWYSLPRVKQPGSKFPTHYHYCQY